MTNKDSRRAKFEQVYERIADELVNDLRQQGISEDAISWYRKVHMGFLVSGEFEMLTYLPRAWTITFLVVN